MSCFLALLLIWNRPQPAEAADVGKYMLPVEGKILGLRTGDLDADGREDVVVLVETGQGDERNEVLCLIRTPAQPVARTGFDRGAIQRVPLEGALAACGAISVGAFGPKGAARIRLLGPEGIHEIDAGGRVSSPQRLRTWPTLLARSPETSVVFWDQHADLDGDGIDELWFPGAAGQGAMHVLGGTPATTCTLSLDAGNRATRSDADFLIRASYVPRLEAADLDGDGRRELVALKDAHLVAWQPAASKTRIEPSLRVPLPFLEQQEELPPNELRTPRLQLADVDGDRITDLLVTLVWGRTDRLGTLRTTLLHYPGPLLRKDGQLPKALSRIDTESVTLHPRFIDLDGDGGRDYIGDSIRGDLFDLIRRLQGEDPQATFVGYRFDKQAGTYAKAPAFQTELGYSSEQALSNTFSQSAWFEGDFDGDGHRDLLDLGNLASVRVMRGQTDSQGRCTFETPIVPRLETPSRLEPHAVVRDIDGNGKSDALLYTDKALLWLQPKGGR